MSKIFQSRIDSGESNALESASFAFVEGARSVAYVGLALCVGLPSLGIADESSGASEQTQSETAKQEEPTCKKALIPLSDVWALDSPGTRYLRALGGDPVATEKKVDEIRKHLIISKERPIASSGFVVKGTKLKALDNLRRVIATKEKAEQQVSAGGECWAVMFARSSNFYVYLVEVQKRKNLFTVKYRFISHAAREMAEQVALIPLGELTEGKYRVEFVPDYEPQEFEDSRQVVKPSQAQIERIVSKSFEFSVTK